MCFWILNESCVARANLLVKWKKVEGTLTMIHLHFYLRVGHLDFPGPKRNDSNTETFSAENDFWTNQVLSRGNLINLF
jgi:hypothetical protein